LRERFKTVACVEILDIAGFCGLVQAALPAHAAFAGPKGNTRIGQRVEYYPELDAVNPRWALPDMMATSKPVSYAWQDEFRLVFSLSDALEFEKVDTRVIRGAANHTPDPSRHHTHLLKVGSLRNICRIALVEQAATKPVPRTFDTKASRMGERREAYCLIDESGSLSRDVKEPFRVGFLMTCRPERLREDIERLKRELPLRGKSGEYHAKEDEAQTRAAMRSLLCLNTEPQMYIVEWRKEQFPDAAFTNGKLHVLQDSNPLIASFAITVSDIVANFSVKGYSFVQVVVEATIPDLASNHRAHRQALNQLLPVMLEKHAKKSRAPAGTMTKLHVSTVRKKDCPILSFADYWLWAYSRRHDRDDATVFPAQMQERTHVRVMTHEDMVGSVRDRRTRRSL
jgi:hypothetical protein